jgi:biopolymer transport protein ExbD
MKRILLVLTILFFAANINAQSVQKTYTQKKVNQKEFIQLSILKTGKILVNNRKVTQKELEIKLKTLKQKNGIVHFYQSPSVKKSFLKKNLEIIKLISKNKLPMKQYKDKNFTKEFLE